MALPDLGEFLLELIHSFAMAVGLSRIASGAARASRMAGPNFELPCTYREALTSLASSKPLMIQKNGELSPESLKTRSGVWRTADTRGCAHFMGFAARPG